MALIIDSSQYVTWLRARVDLHALLHKHITDCELHNVGIIRAEVCRGLSDPIRLASAHNFFDIIPEVPTTAKVWRTVADLAWTLDRKGIVLPVSDLVIAASALEIGAAVVTTDEHFRKIPKLRVLKRLP